MNLFSSLNLAARNRGLWHPHLAAAGVIGLSSLLHLALAGRFALSVDEAHYALYGMHLDWSYFDHPPMVGWLQAVALLAGESEWVLRFWAALLTAAAGLLLYRLTREWLPEHPPWTATLAVGLLNAAILFQLLGFALIPEVPFLVFALAAALWLYRAVHRGGPGPWIAAGLCLGLAGLAKYTAVLLVVSAVLLLASERQWRQLATPWPWLGAVFALVVVSPVLVWNLNHDWISFSYQLGHGAPERDWTPARFALAQLGQLLAYGPHVVLFGIAGLILAWQARTNAGMRATLCFTLPLLGLFAVAAGHETTLPHWTLVGWTFSLPVAAAWVWQRFERRWVRRIVRGSAIYAGAMLLLVLTELTASWIPFAPYRHPVGDLHGWREAAEQAADWRQRLFAGEPAPIFVGNWTLASRIGWYARPASVQVLDRRFDQFDLWYGIPEPGARGILLTREQRGEARLTTRFSHCEPLEFFEPQLDGRSLHRFGLYACRGYLG